MIRCGTGANIELFEYVNPRGSKAMPQLAEAGASHIAFYTEDIVAGVAYLKSHGITVLGEPITMTAATPVARPGSTSARRGAPRWNWSAIPRQGL
jgi:catechol 2,3-dioxygenase-like lactoylglutathione lyase family enzyme